MSISRSLGRPLRSTNSSVVRVALCIALIVVLRWNAWAGQWIPLGPNGGDARSLAYDRGNPGRIYLGTSTGTIFRSTDGGQSWARLVQLEKGDDLVLDHIVVDPRNSNNIYVAGWRLDDHHSGDLFRSQDGGKHWNAISAMHGKSIRAIAVATPDSKMVVVGTLDGVFRSRDEGQTWRKISRQNAEIRNVESVAIDAKNSDIVYIGTRHLAWKTSNGGTNWSHVKNGIIDDSDVFSIILDESNPQTVFLSACSGIYKSLDSGHVFERIQGIPFSARRTRVLKQDPNNSAVVYAGTTEGLWATGDSGTTWKRVTSPEIVVNDILVDPESGRVLLAADRAGVLASDNGQLSFATSNSGFTHRYISSILVDQQDPNLLYASVVNDRELGGIVVSNDAGQHWREMNAGLDGRDVFALKQLKDGSILAGTNNGMFLLGQSNSQWIALGNAEQTGDRNHAGEGENTRNPTPGVKVNDIEITPAKWFAATSTGLYSSSDEGRTWKRDVPLRKLYLVSVRARGHIVVVAGTRKVLVSLDHGNTWRASRNLPAYVSGIQSLAITPDEQILIASREGAFRSQNLGARWNRIYRGLPGKNTNCITYDSSNERLLATATGSTAVYESKDWGYSWRRLSDTGYPLRAITAVSGRLFATTRFDGVIAETQSTNEHH
jgi:photosystem II stability/assembly factor-like uncharacterized protein